MTTKTVDVRNAKPDVKELLTLVGKGTEIVFTEDDHPIARLVPLRQRLAGLHLGAIRVSPDFDEPLSDEFWTGNV